MDFTKTKEIADFLGKQTDVAKLDQMEEFVSSGKIFLTFWGHFSAGKSRLINRIIGSDILPVHNTETTAVLTYIQSDEENYCNIIFESGNVQKIELEKVKTIFQNSEEIDVNTVDHLEVFVKDSNLKKGVIIVDTPGVNTIIQKHQNLAASAMEQAGKIFYVLGGAVSNVDKDFIININNAGIETIFIRTKCDLINSNEENPEETLATEKEFLKNCLEKEIDYIPVSSENESSYFSNINLIQNKISEISSNVEVEIENAAKKKIAVMLAGYKKELVQENGRIKDILEGDDQKIQNEIAKCEKEIAFLENVSSNSEKSIEQKIKSAKKDSEQEIEGLLERRNSEFSTILSKTDFTQNAEKDLMSLCQKKIADATFQIQQVLDSYIGEIISSEQKESISEISSVQLEIDVPEYTEIEVENSDIVEMYREKLYELKNEISSIIDEHKNLSEQRVALENDFNATDYEEALAELEDELKKLPTEPLTKLSEKQDIQPSQIFKQIGNAADMALLLLPGTAIASGVKAVSNGTKLAQVIHKSTKLTKVLGTIAKNAKSIDIVRDIGYGVNQVLKQRNYSTQAEKAKAAQLIEYGANAAQEQFDKYRTERQNGNVLDMLSVAYWTEKIGRKFDSPPRIEIDVEAERERNFAKEQIFKEKEKIFNEQLRKKKELGLIKSKEDEMQLKAKEKLALEKTVETELRAQEMKIMEKARTEAFMNYKNKFKPYFSDCISKIANTLTDEYFSLAEQNISFYIARKNSDFINAIAEKKSNLEKLIDMKNSANGDLKNRQKTCENFINGLQ